MHARHAVDAGGAVITNVPAWRLNRRGRERLGIAHPDADLRHGVSASDESLVDRERADGRQHVAAVLVVSDLGPIGPDLKEELVHICVGATGPAADGHLRGPWVATTHAIDLSFVR